MLGDSWRHRGRLGLFTPLRKPRCADNNQTTHQDQLIAICVMLVAYPACPKKQGPLGRIKFTSPSILCTTGELYPTAAHTSGGLDTVDLLLYSCSGRRCRVKVLTGLCSICNLWRSHSCHTPASLSLQLYTVPAPTVIMSCSNL